MMEFCNFFYRATLVQSKIKISPAKKLMHFAQVRNITVLQNFIIQWQKNWSTGP